MSARQRLAASGTLAIAAVLALVSVYPFHHAAPLRAVKATIAGQLAPVPASGAATITTEYGYNAFPCSVRLADGSAVITAYKSGPSHGGPTSSVTIRRTLDGQVWGEGEAIPLPAGYAYGPSGLAAETAAQGGRLYLAVSRAHYPANAPNSPDEQRAWLYTSDDGGLTWAQRAQFPTTPGTYGIAPSAVVVLADGTVLAAGYASDNTVRLLSSADRGATFTSAGTITPAAGHQALTAQLGQLSDGRVLAVYRDDLTGANTRFLASFRTGAAAWSGPTVLLADATSLNGMTVASDGVIAVMYRGWADKTDDGPSFRPARILLARATATGIETWRTNLDLDPALLRRSLGGNIVAAPTGSPSPWLAVWGVEGPLTTAMGATVVSEPVDLRQAP